MRRIAILAAILVITASLLASAQTFLLKSPVACYNTASTDLGNLAFGKGGVATDGNAGTNTSIDLDGFVIDLNSSYPITSFYVKGFQTAACPGGDVFTISASNNGSTYTTIETTSAFSVIEPLEQSKNITPSNYRYWNVTRSRATNCVETRLTEIQLNASPQTCFPNFFQLVNYTNSTSWMAVYSPASFNQSTNTNRIILEENNSNGNITEIEDKFKHYGHQYVVMAAYNSTLNEVYSAHKTSTANGACRKTNVKKIPLSTHAITTTGIDSGAGDQGHFMVAGFGAGYAYVGTSQKNEDCSSGGASSWKTFRVTLQTGNVQSWINDSTDLNAHYYFVRDSDVLDLLVFDTNVERKRYYWSVNSTNLSAVYASPGRDHQAYFVDGGKSVVFSSDQSGNNELYVVPEDCNASCSAQRLSFTPENESIKSVLDVPERKMFVVAFNTSTDPFKVFAREFYTAPFGSKASVNSTVAGSPALFSVFWQAAYNVSHYIFSTNNSGQWVNDSTTAFANAPDGWSNVSKALNSTPGTAVGWKVYANDSRGAWSVVEQQLVTTDAKPPAFSNPSHNSTRAGHSTRFTVEWADDGNLSNYVFGFDNGTGNFTNDSARNFSGTSALSDVTKKLSELTGVVARWRVYAWDAANNSNSTPVQSLTTVEAVEPGVSLAGGASASNALSIFFNFTASDASALQSATLYANFSGSWATNASNSSVLLNASSNSITVSGIPEGNYVWNVLVCDANGNCAFASTNNSLRVDRTRPNATTPSVQSSSSGQATFSWEASENSTGTVEYWTGSDPPTNSSNSTQSSSLSVSLSSLSSRTTYNYRTWTCDEAGNCRASETNSFLSGGAGSELSTPSGGGSFFAVAPPSPTASAEESSTNPQTTAASQPQTINAITPTPGQLPVSSPAGATVSSSPSPTPVQQEVVGSTPSATQAPFTGLALAGNFSLNRDWLALFLVLLAVALGFALTHFSKKREAEPPVKREDFNPPAEIEWVEWK